MGCLGRSRDDWIRRSTGVASAYIFWMSIVSVALVFAFRDRCTIDSSVVPMVLLPTGIMGLFTSAFVWLLITYLWLDDAYDPMKIVAYASAIVTAILQFISFGFAISKVNHYECRDPFFRYAVATSFLNGVVLSVFIVLYGINKRLSSAVNDFSE